MVLAFLKDGLGVLGYAILLYDHPCLAYAFLMLHYALLVFGDFRKHEKLKLERKSSLDRESIRKQSVGIAVKEKTILAAKRSAS